MTDPTECIHERKEKIPEYQGISFSQIREHFSLRHFSTLHVLQFFADDHLPPILLQITVPIRVVAFDIVDSTQDGPELTVALRKLVDARDSFVRHYMSVNNLGYKPYSE